MKRKQNNLEQYMKTEKTKQKSRIDKQHKKEVQRLEGPKVKLHIDSLWATLKKVPNWKITGHDYIHIYRFKKSPPSMTDWISKWLDAWKKPTYRNEKSKKRPPWIKKFPQQL